MISCFRAQVKIMKATAIYIFRNKSQTDRTSDHAHQLYFSVKNTLLTDLSLNDVEKMSNLIKNKRFLDSLKRVCIFLIIVYGSLS